VRKHCSNLQCFKEKKLQSSILNQLHIKKKINKNDSGKKKHKKMKKMKTILRKKMEKKHVEKVKAKFSTRSILKK
jgi:hypothetical protein